MSGHAVRKQVEFRAAPRGADSVNVETRFTPRVLASFGGDIASLVIGDVDDLCDTCVLVEYPSAAEFSKTVMSPEVAAIGLDNMRHTVVDHATGNTNPALWAPRGLDYGAVALGNGQVAAQIVGDPYGGGSRRFVFRYTEVGSEHPSTQ